jgi:iron complex outermembrane receptor protein
MVQAFSEKRHLRSRRPGDPGYSRSRRRARSSGNRRRGRHAAVRIPDLANVCTTHAARLGVLRAGAQRDGGLIDIQIAAEQRHELRPERFTSKLKAANYNRNFMLWGSSIIGADQAPETGYVVRNSTLVSANFANMAARRAAPVNYGVYDQISRPTRARTRTSSTSTASSA